jgi:hypothetical protein
MKIKSILRDTQLFVFALMGAALLSTFPKPLGSQLADSPFQADIRDLESKKTALGKDFNDMATTAQSLQGIEGSTLTSLSDVALYGAMEIDATISFLEVYRNMQCEPDRATAKSVLKKEISVYSGMLDKEIDLTAGLLTFTKFPATSSAILRMRDELRDTKGKLDAIAASLQ